MTLSTLDFLNGTLSTIVVGISIYVGLYILSKYFQNKNKLFLYVGIVAMCISEPWWPHVVSFFIALSSGANGLDPVPYYFLGNVLIPIAIYLWLMAISKFLFEGNKKLITMFGIVYVIAYEIIFFTFLILDPNLIGTRIGVVDVQYGIVIMGLMLTALVIILITGLMFAKESLSSENKEVRMKGKFLMLAFICFCAGAAIDVTILSNPVNLTIARVLLVISAFGFLGGFVPPGWMKKVFLKEE